MNAKRILALILSLCMMLTVAAFPVMAEEPTVEHTHSEEPVFEETTLEEPASEETTSEDVNSEEITSEEKPSKETDSEETTSEGMNYQAPAIEEIAEAITAYASSGTCGTNLTWTLDNNGTLTISGTGAMTNYSSSSSVPWYSNKSSVKKVVISSGVTSIGNSAFYRCTSLTSITIPNSVTSIGEYAFYWCTSLTSITIPDSVTSIGEYAFSSCSKLTSITIPDSVTSIGDDAFYNCRSLTSVTIGDSVTSIGSMAFLSCSSLTAINVDSNNPNYSSIDGVLFNKNQTTLTTCPGGKSGAYTIPDNVTSIGDRAFYYCTSLTSITIPDSVTSIGSDAFYDCTSLTSVTIPDSVTTIGSHAFSGCTSLTSVTIPDSVTSIGDMAFSSCDSLTAINVDSNNPNYSSIDGVLFDKNQTTLITCPGGKSGAYTIPDNVTSIGDRAFYYCTSLTSITIPDSVTSIGSNAFSYCRSLTSVTIPDSVTSIGSSAFYNCTSLTSVTIPDSVTSIGSCAFYYCTSLTSVTIPDSVTSIGSNAFSYCRSLTSVTIPDSVTSIGSDAFCDCDSLTDVYYNGTKSQKDAISIGDDNTNLTNATWHYFDNSCDTSCNECGTTRTITHTYSNNCDANCNVCGATRTAVANHVYDNACDTSCNVCGETRTVGDHVYDNACDTVCNECGTTRVAGHTYTNACDSDCNECGLTRETSHTYDNEKDIQCNECGEYIVARVTASKEPAGADFGTEKAIDKVTSTGFKTSSYLSKSNGGQSLIDIVFDFGKPINLSEMYTQWGSCYMTKGAVYGANTANATEWALLCTITNPTYEKKDYGNGATIDISHEGYYRYIKLCPIELSSGGRVMLYEASFKGDPNAQSEEKGYLTVDKLDVEEIDNTAHVYLGYYNGISAEVYNYLKDQGYDSIFFINDECVWTFTKGDYVTTNVTEPIFLGTTIDTKLWTLKNGYIVEDTARENAVLKALGNTRAEPLYLTVAENCNVKTVAPNAKVTVAVSSSWLEFHNKFSVTAYRYDAVGYNAQLTKVAENLVIKPATEKLTVNIKEPGLYVLIDEAPAIADEYCPGHPHVYDNDNDTSCNNCGYERFLFGEYNDNVDGEPVVSAVMSRQDVMESMVITVRNEAVIYMPAGIDGISAAAYNILKSCNYDTITFVDYEGEYTWTLTRGDYTKMNVSANIYFGVGVDIRLWTTDENQNVVEDVELTNDMLKALGNEKADPFYLTIDDAFNLRNVASKPELTVTVSESWTTFNNKFDIDCYRFNGRTLEKVADGLAVEPLTNKLTFSPEAAGIYVFVDASRVDMDCHIYEHVYDNDCDAKCDHCGYTRTPAGHIYDNVCDVDCNECGRTRTAPHNYEDVCDTVCNDCTNTRTAPHNYDGICDAECNSCGETREIEHRYSDSSDATCNWCGHERVVEAGEIVFENARELYDGVNFAPGTKRTFFVTVDGEISDDVKIYDTNGSFVFSEPEIVDQKIYFAARALYDGARQTTIIVESADGTTRYAEASASIVFPEAPMPDAVMDRAAVEAATTVDNTNKATVMMAAGVDGIAAAAYNYLKSQNHETITFVDAEGAYTWTLTRGDYTKMNVTASIYFGVEVGDKLYKLDENENWVEDTARENAILKALGNTRLDVFYVTINNNVNIQNVASKPVLTIDVYSTWVNYNNKFDVDCYKFDGEYVTKAAEGLSVKPATGLMTLYLTAAGTYVFVDADKNVSPALPPHDHTYDNGCDAECNVCGATREVGNHVYDNACDVDCNECSDMREASGHVYDNTCDTDCNECGTAREIDHTYDNGCDAECNVCGETRTVGNHIYSHTCDTDCNECGYIRVVSNHVFDNKCDSDCNACGALREANAHVYDNEYDATCNECGETRAVGDPDAPTFTVQDTTATVGKTFTVAVSTRNNVGIVSLKFNVGYDADVLELVSIEEADFADTTFSAVGKNPISVLWEDVLSDNNTTNGTVALLTFKVKDTASAGTTEITITYDPEDVYDYDMNNVGFAVENGTITVIEYISGDVNGDGNVNNKDYGILRQYLNNWEVNIDERAADVNRDGKVNNKDLGILRRYLNNWDVELK